MYTRELGIRSYIINGVRKPKARISMASLQPFNLLELEVYEKANANLQRVKELKAQPLLVNISEDFKRRAVAMFLVEILNACLINEDGDNILFDFLEQKILELETTQSVSNFPIIFLIELSAQLGIEPYGLCNEITPYFDLQMGTFVADYNENTLDAETSLSMFLFMQDASTGEPAKIASKWRRELLKQLTLYYQIHIMHNREIKSLDVLAEVMDAWHNN